MAKAKRTPAKKKPTTVKKTATKMPTTAKKKPTSVKKPLAKKVPAKKTTAPTAKTFKYFAADGALNIPSSRPAKGTETQILDAIQDLRAVEGNFLGIIVPSGTLQFYCEGADWLIDVPIPEKGGSLQRKVTVDSMETTRMEYAKAVLSGTLVTELPKLKFKKF